MKRLSTLLAALLAAALFALPAMAETIPAETTIGIVPIAQETGEVTQAEVTTTQAPATTTEAPTTMEYATYGIQPVPYEADNLSALRRADAVNYAALCLSLLALLLAIIALARSGKRKSANATGNYKKFF